jgi:hypothetical protein
MVSTIDARARDLLAPEVEDAFEVTLDQRPRDDIAERLQRQREADVVAHDCRPEPTRPPTPNRNGGSSLASAPPSRLRAVTS